jgi:hypothetical protein
MLMLSPTRLFLVPGLALFLCGLLAMLVLMAGPVPFGPIRLDIHTLALAGFASIVGLQLVVFAQFIREFAIVEGFLPPSQAHARVLRYASLEKGVLLGSTLLVLGLLMIGGTLVEWSHLQFGDLTPSRTMRSVIPAAVCCTMGVQVVFSSFFLNILTLMPQVPVPPDSGASVPPEAAAQPAPLVSDPYKTVVPGAP